MTMRKAGLTGAMVTVLVILPLLARSAGAATVVTSSRPVSPAVGYSSWDGSFLAVWAEDRGTGTGLDLYAARLNASGVAAGVEVPVVIEPGNQSDPAIVWSEHNRAYLLIYTNDGSGSPAPTTPGVPYPGQTPTSGLPIPGGTATATPPLPPIPFLPQARTGPSADGWAVVDQAPPTVPPTVGPPPTGVPPIATPTLPAPGPTATTDPNAPPPPPPTTSSTRDLYGTWVSLSGWRITSTFAVSASPADDTYPSLGYVRRPDGDEYVLVWLEITGTNSAIKAMRLDGWGFFFVPSTTYSVASGGDVGRPSVAGEANEGDWFVVWAQTATGDPSRDLFGRRMNSNGVPYGAPRLLASGTSDQAYPSIGSLGAAGGYILAWENREQGMAPDIRVRRLNRSGVAYTLESNLAGGAAFSFAPNIASSDAETTLVVWLDRNAAGDNSVLGAVVSRDGRRRGAERLIVQGGAGPAGVTPVVPPPGLPTVPVPVPPGPPVLPTP